MKSISILHLSDLHISVNNFTDQKVVLDALFTDVRKQREDGQKFDLVLFSGDLIGKGDYSETNQRIVEQNFVIPLLEAAGLSKNDFFLVPGNHDVQVSKIDALLKPSFDALNSVQITNNFIDKVETSPYFFVGLESYNNLAKKISTATPVIENMLFKAYKASIKGIEIGICCINSAWKATGRPNNADYGALQVGQRQLDILLDAVKDCQLKLAILHHPLNWLVPFDQSVIQQQIYRDFDAVFYGHNHHATSLQLASPIYSSFVSNAGCLYQSRDWFNGYSIVTANPSESVWKIKVREYYNNRNVFDVSTRFSERGEASFKLERCPSTELLMQFPTADYITAVQESVNGYLLTASISDIAPKSIGALFVSPPLSQISERQLDEDNNNGEELNFLELSELLASSSPLIFVGQKEYGKTTLLHYICSTCNGISGGVPTFGCYINLDSVKQTTAGLIDAIISFSKGSCRKAEVINLLQSGGMAICFDNLPAQDEKLLNVLKSFIQQYENNRFYFSINENFQASLSNTVIPKLGLNAKIIYLHSFGRRQTRNLISKWFGESNDVIRSRVDTMLSSLKRLNIPRTPFLISILLWVQEKNIPFSPVNQAEIIDVLIDGVLDKLHETKKLSSLDSTAKRHFLTELAFELYKIEKKRLTHNELDAFTINYFSTKGLPYASGPFISELQQKGVLIDLGEEVSFKFDCVRAFFLSIRIKESDEFFKVAMTPEGFLKLGEELDYFTGKNRDQKEALVGALEVVDRLFAKANFDLDLSLFDEVSLKDSPINAEQKEALEQQLLGERPSPEMHEEMLDEMDITYRSAPRKEIPKDAKGTGLDFIGALQTASAMLRNSELIDDVQLKNDAYTRLTYYWCQILLATLVTLEFFADKQEQKAAEELVEEMPLGVGIYLMKLLVPNAIFNIVHEKLGTAKLELMIRKSINDSSTTVSQLVSSVLYTDLELPNRLEILKNLANKDKATRFLKELIFFKLFHLYTFRKLSAQEEQLIKPLLGSMFAELSDAKNKAHSDALKSKLLEQLDRQMVIKEVRNKSRD